MNSQLLHQRLIGSLSEVACSARESGCQELDELVLEILSCSMSDQDQILSYIAALDDQKKKMAIFPDTEVEVDFRALYDSSNPEAALRTSLWNSLQKLASSIDRQDDQNRPALIAFIYRCLSGLKDGGDPVPLQKEMEIASALVI